MIKFFRKIRQNLLSAGKTGKYFKYAIGEIVLVVIGILIALQINNWNEQRKQDHLEQDYLIALKREFENNVKEVDRVIELNAKLFRNALELAKYTGVQDPNLTEERFSELYFSTINTEVQYRPGTGVVNEIINSGKLSIFQNAEIKNALSTLDGLLLRIRFQEDEELAVMRQDLISSGKKSLGLRRMAYDAYGESFGVDKGEFLGSNLHILQSLTFDNHLVGFIYTSGFLDERYHELKMQLHKVIDVLNAQIKL